VEKEINYGSFEIFKKLEEEMKGKRKKIHQKLVNIISSGKGNDEPS